MCDKSCIYFPEEVFVESEIEENGVKYRKVKRRCGYSGKQIKNWRECHRADGALYGKN